MKGYGAEGGCHCLTPQYTKRRSSVMKKAGIFYVTQIELHNLFVTIRNIEWSPQRSSIVLRVPFTIFRLQPLHWLGKWKTDENTIAIADRVFDRAWSTTILWWRWKEANAADQSAWKWNEQHTASVLIIYLLFQNRFYAAKNLTQP